MERKVEDFIRRHWLACTIVSFFLIWVPEVVSNIWGLFSGDPLFPALLQKAGGMSMPIFSSYWLTVPLSVFILFFIAYFKMKEFGYLQQTNSNLATARLPDGFISLRGAVEKLHNAAKQGKIPMMGAETMSGGTLENPSAGSEEDIYTWWAIRIAKDNMIEMRGRRPPGDIERILTFIKKDFLFVEKATKLKDPMNDEVYYTDLCVRKDELEASYYLDSGFHMD